MTNTEDIEGLFSLLDKNAIAFDGVILAIRKALQSQQEEIASLKEDSIRVCNRETELLEEVKHLTTQLARYKHTPEAYKIMQESVTRECAEAREAEDKVEQLTKEQDRMREALELAHEHMRLHIPQYRSKKWNVRQIIDEALQDTPEGGCEHGRDMIEECQECGRINGGE